MIDPVGSFAQPVDIVVPIFNAFEETLRCLNALLSHTRGHGRIYLINDASTDARISSLLLVTSENRTDITVLSNKENHGFVGTVNRGLAITERDVIVLNSDTMVTPGWLDKMIQCRDSDRRIGIVCPLSNNATLLTVPDLEALATLGDRGPDTLALHIAANARSSYPRLPTAVGFCMLITQQLRECIGSLDPAFGRGYGEENDFSMRALEAGFEIACADNAYVHHVGGASFGVAPQVEKSRQRNASILRKRWPGYESGVSRFLQASGMRAELERARAAVARVVLPSVPHVLQVTQRFEAVGGVEEHVRGLVSGLSKAYRMTVMYPQPQPGLWMDATSWQVDKSVRLLRYRQENISGNVSFFGGPATLGHEGVESFFSQLIEVGDIDLVHIQSLVPWGTLSLAILARRAGLPVVLSIHDFFLLCPDYNMRLHSGRPCGKVRATEIDADCTECLFRRQAPGSAGRIGITQLPVFLVQRNLRVSDILKNCDAIVVPSRFLADRIMRAYPQETSGKLRIIPHGVPLLAKSPRSCFSRLRVTFLGRFNEAKGSSTFISVARQFRGRPVDFDVLGPTDAGTEVLATNVGIGFRGVYRVEDLPLLLASSDLVVIPSCMEETFCLALSETMQAGVPVAASAIGAITERIEDGVTGFLVRPNEPEDLVSLIESFIADRSPLDRVAKMLAGRNQRSTEQACENYNQLYAGLLENNRHVAANVLQTSEIARPRAGDFLPFPATGFGSIEYRRFMEIEETQLKKMVANPGVRVHFLVWNLNRPAECTRLTLDSLVVIHPCTLSLVDIDLGDAAIEAANASINASGCDWFVSIEAGDRLHPRFVAALQFAIADCRDPVVAIANEDSATTSGQRYAPVFRPGLDKRLDPAVGVGHFCAFRSEVAMKSGGIIGWGPAASAAMIGRMLDVDGQSTVCQIHAIVGHRLDLPEDQPTLAQPETISIVGGASLIIVRYSGIEAIGRLLHRFALGDADVFAEILVPLNEFEKESLVTQFHLHQIVERIQLVHFDPLEPTGRWINRALRQAKAEFVFVVRDVIEVLRGSIIRMLQPFAAKEVGAVTSGGILPGGRVCEGWLALGYGVDGIAGYPALGAINNVAEIHPALFGAERKVSAFSFDCFALRRKMAIDAEGFTEFPPLSSELTVDFAIRLCALDIEIVSLPQVCWRMHASFAAEHPAIWAQTDESRDWMLKRHSMNLNRDPCYSPALTAARDVPVPEIEVVVPHNWEGFGLMKVMAFPFDSWGSGHYRVRSPVACLARAGKVSEAVMPNHDSGRVPTPIEMLRMRPDTILAHNFLHDYQLRACRSWRRHLDTRMIFGMDDLLINLPHWNPHYLTMYRDIEARLRAALSMFDSVIVSTKFLADALSAWHRDIVVIENALDESLWKEIVPMAKDDHRPRVGWAGANQHSADLAWLEPVLASTKSEVDWVFMGAVPKVLAQHAKEIYPMTPLAAYPGALAALRLDLAIAPLENHPFNRAKSNIKLLEYGALSLPIIASDIEPYREGPARLLRNKPAEWREAIIETVRDRNDMAMQGLAMARWVRDNGYMASKFESWYDALG